MNQNISKVISFLRFPLILLVVLIHVPRIENGPEYYNIISTFLSSVVSGIAVPMFFAISGYLFFLSEFTTTKYCDKLRKRVYSLLIPYLLWNLFSLIVLVLPHYKSYDFTVKNVLISFWNCHDSFIHAVSSNPIDFPMWYIRDLMICNLMAPAYYYIIRYTKFMLPLTFIALWVFGILSPVTGISVIAVAFYSFGAYMAIHHRNVIDERKGLWSVVGVILFTALCLCLSVVRDMNHREVIICLTSLVGILCIPSATCKLCKKESSFFNHVCQLTRCSFFIYAAHAIIIKPIYNTLERIGHAPEIIVYFLTFAVTVGVCYAGWWLSNRFMPRFSKLINGR